MVASEPTWSWKQESVDMTHEHVKISYSDIHNENNERSTPVAQLGPPRDGIFPAQFVLKEHHAIGRMILKLPLYIQLPIALVHWRGFKRRMMFQDVSREIDGYLVEKREPDPWAYAIYHCNTSANVYSTVHWSYFSGKMSD